MAIIEVEVTCRDCGVTLDSKDSGVTIEVYPCEACLKVERQQGYEEAEKDLA